MKMNKSRTCMGTLLITASTLFFARPARLENIKFDWDAETRKIPQGASTVNPSPQERLPQAAALSKQQHDEIFDSISYPGRLRNLLAESPALINARYEPEPNASARFLKRKGWTPLHFAIARHGHVGSTKVLLEHGADVNVRGGERNDSPLHLGADYNRLDKVPLLIEAGADINIQNRWGVTPVHEAVNSKSMAVLEQLVAAGADINLLSNKGYTPLDIAIKYRGGRNTEMARFLIERGAREGMR